MLLPGCEERKIRPGGHGGPLFVGFPAGYTCGWNCMSARPRGAHLEVPGPRESMDGDARVVELVCMFRGP